MVNILGFTIHLGNHIKTFNYLINLLHDKLILKREKSEGQPALTMEGIYQAKYEKCFCIHIIIVDKEIKII